MQRPLLLSPHSPCSSCHVRVFSLKEEMFLPSKVRVCKGAPGHSDIQLPTASVRGRPRPGSPAHPREEPRLASRWLSCLTKCVFCTLVPIRSLWPFLTPSVNSKIPSILFNECSCTPFCCHEPWLSPRLLLPATLSRGSSPLLRALYAGPRGRGRPPGSFLLSDHCSLPSFDARTSRSPPPDSLFPSYPFYSSWRKDV